MIDSIGILDTDYMLAYMFATIFSGLAIPMVGPYVDRYGARIFLSITSVSLALTCVFMSQVEHITSLYMGLSLLRIFGQGLMCLLGAWLVGEWFEQRRGFAMGVSGFGGALSVATVPLGNAWLIEANGWQETWIPQAWVLAIAFIVPPFLLVRDRPEAEGLFPDCRFTPIKDEPDDQTEYSPHITRDNWERSEALRNSTFWKLVLCWASTSLVGTGIVIYQKKIFQEVGVPDNQPYYILALQACVAIGTCLTAGHLTTRVQARYLMATAMFLLSTSMLILLTMTEPWLAIVVAILLGTQGGIIRTVGSVVWVNYYGRKNQGAISGAALSLAVIGSALGPLPLALSSDFLGSTTPALVSFFLLPLVAGLLVLTATPPKRTIRE
ncbi:MAG: MFS transporter [Pirellulales bacterium]|nr:MFS transporter [Pirellulales bacterium]